MSALNRQLSEADSQQQEAASQKSSLEMELTQLRNSAQDRDKDHSRLTSLEAELHEARRKVLATPAMLLLLSIQAI